jgi:hypothetical protein
VQRGLPKAARARIKAIREKSVVRAAIAAAKQRTLVRSRSAPLRSPLGFEAFGGSALKGDGPESGGTGSA